MPVLIKKKKKKNTFHLISLSDICGIGSSFTTLNVGLFTPPSDMSFYRTSFAWSIFALILGSLGSCSTSAKKAVAISTYIPLVPAFDYA